MKENVDLTVFSPTAPLGIFIIFCGLIFSSIVFYIIYAVSTNKESLEDKKMRDKKNPEAYLNGYKDFNKSTFSGYEEISEFK